MKIDKKLIKELTDYLNELGLTELEYGNNELKIKVSKSTSSSNNINQNKTVSVKKMSTEKVTTGTEIHSPIIGTAYLSPEPGAKKFIEVGKKIKKGDTIMIVEAMKTMNHVPSTENGTVKEICVEDGQPVEFGQTIVILD
ncbi:acetyl-CoA carboxylase biotin carboxyl carrier protein subunit [Candidatus Pelagibacter sp.]|nr:acetyl-CoA carboxylase biotin carboxyl carrier protein subunit [Candidatus Pelagibacter sp.]